MMMNAPNGLTAASGIDAVPHALARYAKVADYLGVKGDTDAEKLEGLIARITQPEL